MLDNYWFNPSKSRRSIVSSDPTKGLIEYFNEIKPYHTKLLEVAIRYTHEEVVKVRCGETLHITPHLINRYWDPTTFRCNSGYDLDYGYGYGIIWQGGYGGGLEEGGESRPPLFTDVEYDEPYSDDGYDGNIQPYNTANNSPARPLNLPILEAISSDRTDYPAQTFLVETPTPEAYSIMLTNVESGTFGFVTPYDIINVIPLQRTWIIKGDAISDFVKDTVFYVNANEKIKYTVDTATLDTSGNTLVKTKETISLKTSTTGIAGILITNRALPWWPLNMRVKVINATDDQLHDTLYFKPLTDTTTQGFFNLTFSPSGKDIIIPNIPKDKMIISNVDTFLPGMGIVVLEGGANNGKYTVYRAEHENNGIRIWTIQHIPKTVIGKAGLMNFDNSDGFIVNDYCPIIDGNPLFVQVILNESLTFRWPDDEPGAVDGDLEVSLLEVIGIQSTPST